jgi:hypothetical protein
MLRELDVFEPFEAHLFHDGHLWSGRSRKSIYADYHVYLYDSQGTLLAEHTLEHSARYIYPYGSDRVVVVGVSAIPNTPRYSIVTWKRGRLFVKRHDISTEAWADQAAVGPRGKLYFTAPTGKVETVTKPEDFSRPAQTFFTLGWWGRPHFLKTRLRAPSRPIFVGDALFALENPVLAKGGAAVVRVDLRTEEPSRVFLAKGALSNLVYLPGLGKIAVVDRMTQSVYLLDPQTGKELSSIEVASGTPHAVTELGHCLVIGSEVSQHVSFIDANSGKELARWDLKAAGAKLFGVRAVALDPKSGNLFARSDYPMGLVASSPEDRNGVILVQEESGDTLRACTR